MSLLDDLRIEAHHGSEEVNRLVERIGLGDGLPVVPPTPARVEAMLAGADPEASVAVLAPARAAATRRRLALCAVMAGCAPAHFPVLVAAVAALAEPTFNLLGVQTTTGNAAVGVIVHGPAIAAGGFHAGGNALGPGVRANATVGRALALVLRNVGGAVPGVTDMATLGQSAKYGLCFAEHAAAGAPWGPLHATRGLGRDEGAVTVFAAAGTVEVVDSASGRAGPLLATFAHSLTIAGSLGGGGLLGGGEPLLLLAPEHAALIAGEMSRAQAQRFLWEQARLPLEALAAPVRDHLLASRPPGTAPPSELLVAERPADILLVVVGGVGRKSAYLPSWGGATRAVTRPVVISAASP